ncbi:MAG: anthranilate phosphoribosyltransferase, partial [Anaerostipes sp.]
LFAQTHHGSMKYAGPVRAQLGVRSVFNILGPLANPAMTNYIVLGVYEKALVRPMADVMKNLGVKRAMIVYGDDGLDEISISSTTSVCEINGNEIKEYTIDPEELGLTLAKKESIVGGTADENAVITKDILTGKEQGAKRDIVLLNAGAALYTIGKAETIKDGVKLAAEMINSGKANEKLEQFIAYTNAK